MKSRFNAVLAILFATALIFLPCQDALAVGPASQSVTVNLTVNESVSISVNTTSVSANYSSGNVTYSPITVSYSWTTNGSENNVEVYAQATPLTNGGSSTPTTNFSATVSGTAPIGSFFDGNSPATGGTFGTITDGITVNSAIWIFYATVNGQIAPGGCGAGCTQAVGPHPIGSGTNVVTLTVNPTPSSGSLLPGTYTSTLNFTIQTT